MNRAPSTPSTRQLLGFLLGFALVLSPCGPLEAQSGGRSPSPRWSLSIGVGSVPADVSSDVETLLAQGGFGIDEPDVCWFWCFGGQQYPVSEVGSGWALRVGRRRSESLELALVLGRSTAEARGRDGSGRIIDVTSSIDVVALMMEYRIKWIRLGAGPALYRLGAVASEVGRSAPLAESDGIGVGAIADVAARIRIAGPLFTESRVQQRFAPDLRVGPWQIGSNSLSEHQVDLGHLLLLVSIGLEIGGAPGR